MKPEIIILILVLIVIVFLFVFPFQKKTSEVSVGGVKVKVEIADNLVTQTKGLMFHKPLAAGEGMLFVFKSEQKIGIWMMNVSFPIDIIWINSKKEVVHVVEEAQPCILNCKVYSNEEPAQYVLEVKAGFVKEHKVKVGDGIEIK